MISRSRSNFLILIANLIRTNLLSDKNRVIEIRDSFLNSEISLEEAYSKILEYLKMNDEWYEIIKNKPVYKNLLAISDGKITDSTIIAKVVSSMITQIIIRKNADPSLDFNVVRLNDWIKILENYTNTLTIDIDKVKNLIQDYEILGIIREEID